jgi:RibD C-terminal domain
VQIGLEAVGGTNLEVPSPTVGRQLLELGLIDEIDLHIAPVLLGRASGCTTTPAASRSACTGRPRRPHADRKRRVLTRHEGEDPDRDKCRVTER